MPGLMPVPPVLSTPDTHIFEQSTTSTPALSEKHSDEEIYGIYEVERTVSEIRHGKWSKIALQFPDEMLPDAPRVFEALRNGLKRCTGGQDGSYPDGSTESALTAHTIQSGEMPEERLYILADTSYGACCVDEIAAEHVDADVVVHYGRSCLSPTARLPVIHVFTQRALDVEAVVRAFEDTFLTKEEKIILMADVTYTSHLPRLNELIKERGYANIHVTSILHDPSSPLPNRTVPEQVQRDFSLMKTWHLWHISEPPQSLLLTLSSRLAAIYIYPTSSDDNPERSQPLLAATALSLRRRYALLTSLSTVSIFGILINTLSVKNYLHVVEHVKSKIREAGKKYYTFVVGKVNAAKIANFGEVGGWVVIGCWESSLVESKDFWKPIITPFELELALKTDRERIWTGEWRSDFQGVLCGSSPETYSSKSWHMVSEKEDNVAEDFGGGDLDSELESAPPDFDLRTGRYVSHTRPMRTNPAPSADSDSNSTSKSSKSADNLLIRRTKGDLAIMGGEVSPGAEYLRSKRTWKGLGSDFEIAYDESGNEAGTAIEEGRSGIARGYTTGSNMAKR
ncbi:MAG: hypothetical protein Q9187_001914 [Circinaria calcarea]